MAITITDYHKIIRDAVAATINAQAFGMPVVTVDEIDNIMSTTSIPAIAIACVGPEQNRMEMTTNAQDGLALPVAVILLTSGTSSGAKAPETQAITPFRRAIRSLFNNRRLFNGATQISQVGWCEVSDSGQLFNPSNPAFQKISTALIVNAIGRFPRT